MLSTPEGDPEPGEEEGNAMVWIVLGVVVVVLIIIVVVASANKKDNQI